MKHYYLIVVFGDVEPEIFGPFDTEDARDDKAKAMRAEDGDLENGIFFLDVSADKVPDKVETGAYGAGFLGDDDEEDGGKAWGEAHSK